MLCVRRLQFAPHLPAYPKQQNAAGEHQSDDLQQLDRDAGKADAQRRGGEDADQYRLFALLFGKARGGKADNDRVIAGEHQVDHHDLKKGCEGLRGEKFQHAGHSVPLSNPTSRFA